MTNLNLQFFTGRAACPVCAGTQVNQVYDCALTASPVRDYLASHYGTLGMVRWDMLEGTHFTIMHCGVCDLLYQRHVPSAATFDALYNEMTDPARLADVERDRLTLDNFNEVAGELIRLFRLVGKHPSAIRFLDFGFGYGRWARVARALGAEVYATETGDEKKQIAASLGVEIIPDDAIDDMRFDIVHTEQVLEHVAEPGADFARLARVTTGIFKVAVPPPRNVAQLLKAKGMAPASALSKMLHGRSASAEEIAYMAIQPLEHLNAYSPKTMEWLASHNDLALVGTARQRAVSFDLSGAGAAKRTALDLAKMAAKTVVHRNSGYFLFRPLNPNR